GAFMRHRKWFSTSRTARSVALSAFVFAVAACGVGRQSPTEPACINIAGAYDGTYRNSCGGSGSGPVLVTQVRCRFTALIPGFGGGTVEGEIDGGFATFTLTFSTPCSGSATGTATVRSSNISGTFSGGATGTGCCNPISGSFELTR
ncbi:MAG: hypothetical protein ABIT01_00415, partial [Thermoanaerobaculia bacterium]